MAILPICPSCGLASPEIRCPRCNTLKLVGCDGHCETCSSSQLQKRPGAPGCGDSVEEGSKR